jgi:hypothetical protein
MVQRALVSAVALGLFVTACGPSKDAETACGKGPGKDIDRGARTAGAAAVTGGETAVEGVRTFGGAIGGFLEGGSDGAKEEWNQGKQKTSQTAKEGAQKTDEEANTACE